MVKRNFGRKGLIVNYMRLQYSLGKITSAQFDSTISQYNLERYKGFNHRFGYLIEYNISQLTWTNDSNISKYGNTIAFNPYLALDYQAYWSPIGDLIEIVFGVGPSIRLIKGSIGADKKFTNSILKTEQTEFIGVQGTAQIFVNNLFAKAYYGTYPLKKQIDGFTNGEFYICVGFQADIGPITKKKKSVKDLIRTDLPVSK